MRPPAASAARATAPAAAAAGVRSLAFDGALLACTVLRLNSFVPAVVRWLLAMNMRKGWWRSCVRSCPEGDGWLHTGINKPIL